MRPLPAAATVSGGTGLNQCPAVVGGAATAPLATDSLVSAVMMGKKK